MKKNRLLIALFLLMGAAVAYYFFAFRDNKTTLLAAERQFAVKDTANIHKIFIADRFGTQTTLLRDQAGYWTLDGGNKVRPTAMHNLLEAIASVEIKFKPANAAEDAIIKNLSTEGIKVELYNKKNEIIKTYYVGGSTPDERGTYMMIEGMNSPYVTYLPAWEGNLRFRYNLRGDDWRDRAVFAHEVEDIASVSIEYPRQKNKSFKLQSEGGGNYKVEPFYDITPRIPGQAQRGNCEAFLVGFKSLIAEGFENKNPERDSIIRLIPFAIIELKDKKGQLTQAKIFPIFTDPSVDPKTLKVSETPEVERYYALVNNKDFMMIQNRVFSKVFWAYESFF